jgi:tRNA 5-methylaminomethyl-2-thiouridine biosynthesis bifunctional protein
VVCAEGYIAPPHRGQHTLGASFDFSNEDLSTTVADHVGNLQLLEDISPDLAERLGARNLPAQALQGRAAFRCTSPDYLPMVGPQASCPWLEGLYVNSGHGSRGLITAPLSAELIAAWLCDEPLPLPRSVAEACHPNRFMLRELIRGK